MQEPDLSPILASEVKLLSKVMGLDLPPWRTFFQAHQGKRRQGDLRGLVVLKLKKAGISRSAIVRALGRNQSSVIEWERNALGKWDDSWKAYYDDRAALMAADPTEGIVSALNQLGVELLAAVKRDPTRFTVECGELLRRLAPTAMILPMDKLSDTECAELANSKPGPIILIKGEHGNGR